ncbi:hypothetical protein [Microbacterium schleiferi]|nr:hypothetical protein [Microbacterium schleiferi]
MSAQAFAAGAGPGLQAIVAGRMVAAGCASRITERWARPLPT